jgi:hypothetical protein
MTGSVLSKCFLQSSSVTVLVYDTFKPLVLEAKQDVVVVFYTSKQPNPTRFLINIDDNNCRNVLKFYERIAASLREYHIELAMINMDLNDTPRHGIYSVITGILQRPTVFNFLGYPTIKYFSFRTRLSETFKEEKLIPGKLLAWIHKQSGYQKIGTIINIILVPYLTWKK